MSVVAAPGPEEAAQLSALERRRQEALTAGDVPVLADLLHDTLVHVHAPGVVHSKAELLEHVATRGAYLEITRGELDIRVVGDVAVLVGPLSNRLRSADGHELTVAGIATQVVHRDAAGTWRFLSFQMTPYPTQ